MNPHFKRIACLLCKSKSYKILYRSTLKKGDFSHDVLIDDFKNSLNDYTKHGQIVRCRSCSLVYINPVENLDSYIAAYQDVVDEEYLETEKFRKILSGNHLSHIQKYKSKGSILDVGCFAGFFLDLAKKSGWKVAGIEPSSWASSYARKKGIKIIGKTIETTKLPRAEFDAITMWDVIEHLSQPRQAIRLLSASLKNKGIIAIGTPNVDSLMFKILKGHHPYFIRMHLVLFSPKTLSRLLEEEGFDVKEVYSYGRTYSIDYYLKRIETKIPAIGYLRKFTKHRFFFEYPLTLNFHDEFTIVAQKR